MINVKNINPKLQCKPKRTWLEWLVFKEIQLEISYKLNKPIEPTKTFKNAIFSYNTYSTRLHTDLQEKADIMMLSDTY